MKFIKNKVSIHVLLVALFALTINHVHSQQDPQFTQYMYNTATINPAYAGSRDVLSISGLHRSQWVGLDGAPKTSQLSAHTPLGSGNMGLGVSFYNEEIGPAKENNFVIDYSYTLRFNNDDLKFSFGLKGGFQLLDVDYTKLLIYDPNEAIFQNNIDNRFQPIVGIGGMLHTNKWYIGLSSPNLLNTEHYDNSSISTASERVHIFLTGGYVFNLSDMWEFKPAFLMRGVSGSPLGVDMSANFRYNEKFTLGAAYRLDAALSALAAFQVSNQLMIGYAYDFDTTDLGQYNNGSHEIFMRWELFTKVRKKVSPRFF
jgi:type IX secretion system PorP/SprF family membrane protein